MGQYLQIYHDYFLLCAYQFIICKLSIQILFGNI